MASACRAPLGRCVVGDCGGEVHSGLKRPRCSRYALVERRERGR
jgi:hypothetical protein